MKILAAIFFFAVNLSGVAEISLKSKKWVQCLAFSPDGQRVVAGNDEGLIGGVAVDSALGQRFAYLRYARAGDLGVFQVEYCELLKFGHVL